MNTSPLCSQFRMSFPVDEALAAQMLRFHRVDWDSVVALAIHSKLKMLRQKNPLKPRVAAQRRVSALARRVQKEPRQKLSDRIDTDPSPEEILQRAAEIRLA